MSISFQSRSEKFASEKRAPIARGQDGKALIEESEELFQDLSQMQETWLAGGEKTVLAVLAK